MAKKKVEFDARTEQGFNDFMKRVQDGLKAKDQKSAAAFVGTVDELIYTGPRLHSGSLSLDYVLGGGWAWGRVYELYGAESGGKTTHAIDACVEAIKDGLMVAYVDAEHAFEPSYASKLGLKPDTFLYAIPETGEEVLETVETCLDAGAAVIVVDSVAAMVPKKEHEEKFGSTNPGIQARMMSQAMRKLIGKVMKKRAIIIFINQQRTNIGQRFGPKMLSPGGKALKYYASARIQCRSAGNFKTAKEAGETDRAPADEKVRQEFFVKATKNKIAPPQREKSFYIRYGLGIDRASEILEFGLQYGVLQKKGGGNLIWLGEPEAEGSLKVANGVSGFMRALGEDPELADMIYGKVYEKQLEYLGVNQDGEITLPELPDQDEIEEDIARDEENLDEGDDV